MRIKHLIYIAFPAVLALPGAHATVAVGADEPACLGFNGQAHGLCVTGCELTAAGRDLSEDFDHVAASFEREVGTPFQCDDPQRGSVCFSTAENLCATVLADSSDYRRVARKAREQQTLCGERAASCEEQRWVSRDGRTVLVHTMCDDGFERCERRASRGAARAEATLCHDSAEARVADRSGAICATPGA